MKIGDVSRPRRFADPARLRWYAYHRAVRFAGRMRQADIAGELSTARATAAPRPPGKTGG